MCNEQTGLNYQATVENQKAIFELKRQLHDKEMLIDDLEMRHTNRINEIQDRIYHLEQEVRMIKFYRRQGK